VKRAKLLLGTTTPETSLAQHVQDAFDAPLPPIRGMPVLMAPAMAIAWSCQVENSHDFDLKVCNTTKLAKSGTYMDSESVLDLFPHDMNRPLLIISYDSNANGNDTSARLKARKKVVCFCFGFGTND
jgi:hypothetical protein